MFVSVSFDLAVNVSSLNVVLAGLPAGSGESSVLTGSNPATRQVLFAYVNTHGEIAVGAASSGDTIRVSGVYFTS